MDTSGWRTRVGLLITLIGAAWLFLALTAPVTEPPASPSGEGRRLEFTLLGKSLRTIPISEDDLSAEVRLTRTALPLSLLLLGGFLLFLETGTGAKFEAIVRDRLAGRRN